jgi:uncharacterized protein with HEPN domain
MRDAALEAIGFMRDKGPSDLEEDRMLQFAVIRAIEIVGEAATHVSESTVTAYPAVPWRAAASMRNRLIHGYFDVDTEIVAATVEKELPALVDQLDNILRAAKG